MSKDIKELEKRVEELEEGLQAMFDGITGYMKANNELVVELSKSNLKQTEVLEELAYKVYGISDKPKVVS